MARWLVTRDEGQVAVDGLAELRELARSGRLSLIDLVQPPGATGWLYAQEIPDLRDDFNRSPTRGAPAIPEAEAASSGGNPLVAAVLVLVTAVALYVCWDRYQVIPAEGKELVGEGGLSFTQVVVTDSAAMLMESPEATGGSAIAANSVVDLLAKRGGWYRVRTKEGLEGFVKVDQVLPLYRLGGDEVKAELDPLYNPDQYVEITNRSWRTSDDPKKKNVTQFTLLLENSSIYDMSDVVLQAVLKDGKGHEVKKEEVHVQGAVPAQGRTFIGTAIDPKTKESKVMTQSAFTTMTTADPTLKLEWLDGVEVLMGDVEFTEATLKVLQLRAVPKGG